MQHLIVTLLFAVCLCWVVRRVARIILRAKRGEPTCATCTETSCPLHHADRAARRSCGCGTLATKEGRNDKIPENCKKTRP